MTPEERYEWLKMRMFAIARANSYGNDSVLEELLSVMDVAFWEAICNSHKATIPLDNWVMLCCQNAVLNFNRVEGRRHRRERAKDPRWLDLLAERKALPIDVQICSEDARTVAAELIVQGMINGRRTLYRIMGWDRTWNGLDELREALE